MKKLNGLVLVLSVPLAGCLGEDFALAPMPDTQNPPLPAAGRANALDVPLVAQQTQVWCWAATTEMVLRHRRLPYSQGDVVVYTFGFPAFSTGTTAQMQAAMLALGSIPTRVTDVAGQIDLGNPVIAGYTGSFVGPVVVIDGYDQTGNLLIHDPAYGSVKVPYAFSFSYNGQRVWSSTILIA